MAKDKDVKQLLAENEKYEAAITALKHQIEKSDDDLLRENLALTEQVGQLNQTITDLSADSAKQKTQIKELQTVKQPVNIKGFLLEVGNPFGDGVIRAYRSAGGKSNQPDRLPFVLPDKEDASIAALKNYLLRAAGNKEIVAAIRKVMPEVKKQ